MSSNTHKIFFSTFFLVLITNAVSHTGKRALLSNIVECTTEGSCERHDNIELKLGWVPKIPQKEFQEIDTSQKTIASLNPFTNSTSLQFIKKSEKYTCADGVNECFNSCCAQGLCTDPSNVCTTALKSSSARVYATCIAYVFLAIAYWSFFGYLGVRYSKKKATVLVEGGGITGESKKDRKEQLLNSQNESMRSRGASALDNFDDRFNSNYNATINDNYNMKSNDFGQGIGGEYGTQGFGLDNFNNPSKLNKLNDQNKYTDKDRDAYVDWYGGGGDTDNNNDRYKNSKLDTSKLPNNDIELENKDPVASDKDNNDSRNLDGHVIDQDISKRNANHHDDDFEVKDLGDDF